MTVANIIPLAIVIFHGSAKLNVCERPVIVNRAFFWYFYLSKYNLFTDIENGKARLL